MQLLKMGRLLVKGLKKRLTDSQTPLLGVDDVGDQLDWTARKLNNMVV